MLIRTTRLIVALFMAASSTSAATISGEAKKWHKLTLDFTGPATGETATPNPFTDYRLNVTFSHPATGKTYVVPGYFAADGDAANTSATSGNVWRAHFAPDETGSWTYSASFRSGSNIATGTASGSSAGYFDGDSGSFTIAPSDKTGRDFRGKGRLEYVGKHHLRFAETGEYFMKAGVDAPENLLAYQDFDGDFKTDGQGDTYLKSWSPHAVDWQTGDPVWQGTKGKGLIGAINYLAAEGLNAFSFLTMNINGDDKNVFPYTSYSERSRLDVSKLDQWEIIFEHGTRMGMHLNFKTQETENELLLDGGDTGPQRKLYYREVIARFGHHLALNWNLGEEINGGSLVQKQAWAKYFHDHDPYHHPIVIHNGATHYNMMGNASELTGFSLQLNAVDFTDMFAMTKDYIDRSASAGKPWVVACDEPGDSRYSLRPDNDPGTSHVDARKNALWGNIMAGGAGCEFYFGYALPNSDLTCNDFRSRDTFWDYCRHAVEFIGNNDIPFEGMKNRNPLVSGNGNNANRCLAKTGDTYLVQLHDGGSHTLDLTGSPGTFTVKWFNPRAGGLPLDAAALEGGGIASLGSPPDTSTEDWIVLVKSTNGSTGTNFPPVVNAGPDKSAFLAGTTAHVTLNGTVSDDGRPDEFSLTRIWSQVSGPSEVSFSSTSSASTVATFDTAGTYLLRLAASDSDLGDSDEVSVVIKLPESGGQRTFGASHDAAIEDGQRHDDPQLRVRYDNPDRVSYLQFDLSALDIAATGAVLRLTENGDPSGGPMTLKLYAADSNDWTESNIEPSNAPAKGPELASFTGDIGEGQTVEFNINTHIGSPGIYGFILEADISENDIAFASKENATAAARPLLVLATASNTAPAFSGFAASTVVNMPLTLTHAEILANASDADGDPVSLAFADGATTAGGEIVMNGNTLTYMPAIDYLGPDTFQLIVQDGRGTFTSGDLSISVVESAGISGKSPRMERLAEQGVGIEFTGVPGLSYAIQRSTDLEEWMTLQSRRANSLGTLEIIDTDPPEGNAFYRIAYP